MGENISLDLIDLLLKMENINVLSSEIDLGENLKNYGFNSVSYIKYIVMIEEKFDIEFDEEDIDLFQLLTINDFVSYIENKKDNLL